MSKLVLNDITAGYGSNTALNTNFALIETALENTVSRDGTSPNTMSANLDMNGYRILNELASTGDGFVYENNWTTATAYTVNDLVYVPVGTGSSRDGWTLICRVAHTSGTLNTDYSNSKWAPIAARGASGFGSGDLVSTNNLSDVSNATTARGNLSAAKSGANSDITSLSALSTPLSVAQGGTGLTSNTTYAQTLLDTISTTQGSILYHNGTDWVVLAPGTAGYMLVTGGAGANPSWSNQTRNTTQVAQSGVQSISNATWTTLTFNSEDFDTGSWHSNVTSNSRITVSSTGTYNITALVNLTTSNNGPFGVRLVKNGTTTLLTVSHESGVTTGIGLQSIVLPEKSYSLSASDYIELQVYQGSGSAINTSADYTFFRVTD